MPLKINIPKKMRDRQSAGQPLTRYEQAVDQYNIDLAQEQGQELAIQTSETLNDLLAIQDFETLRIAKLSNGNLNSIDVTIKDGLQPRPFLIRVDTVDASKSRGTIRIVFDASIVDAKLFDVSIRTTTIQAATLAVVVGLYKDKWFIAKTFAEHISWEEAVGAYIEYANDKFHIGGGPTPGGGGSGWNHDAQNHKIINVGTGTQASDAANTGQVTTVNTRLTGVDTRLTAAEANKADKTAVALKTDKATTAALTTRVTNVETNKADKASTALLDNNAFNFKGKATKGAVDSAARDSLVTKGYFADNVHSPGAGTLIELGAGRQWDAKNLRIQNVRDPLNNSDAANVNTVALPTAPKFVGTHTNKLQLAPGNKPEFYRASSGGVVGGQVANIEFTQLPGAPIYIENVGSHYLGLPQEYLLDQYYGLIGADFGSHGQTPGIGSSNSVLLWYLEIPTFIGGRVTVRRKLMPIYYGQPIDSMAMTQLMAQASAGQATVPTIQKQALNSLTNAKLVIHAITKIVNGSQFTITHTSPRVAMSTLQYGIIDASKEWLFHTDNLFLFKYFAPGTKIIRYRFNPAASNSDDIAPAVAQKTDITLVLAISDPSQIRKVSLTQSGNALPIYMRPLEGHEGAGSRVHILIKRGDWQAESGGELAIYITLAGITDTPLDSSDHFWMSEIFAFQTNLAHFIINNKVTNHTQLESKSFSFTITKSNRGGIGKTFTVHSPTNKPLPITAWVAKNPSYSYFNLRGSYYDETTPDYLSNTKPSNQSIFWASNVYSRSYGGLYAWAGPMWTEGTASDSGLITYGQSAPGGSWRAWEGLNSDAWEDFTAGYDIVSTSFISIPDNIVRDALQDLNEKIKAAYGLDLSQPDIKEVNDELKEVDFEISHIDYSQPVKLDGGVASGAVNARFTVGKGHLNSNLAASVSPRTQWGGGAMGASQQIWCEYVPYFKLNTGKGASGYLGLYNDYWETLWIANRQTQVHGSGHNDDGGHHLPVPTSAQKVAITSELGAGVTRTAYARPLTYANHVKVKASAKLDSHIVDQHFHLGTGGEIPPHNMWPKENFVYPDPYTEGFYGIWRRLQIPNIQGLFAGGFDTSNYLLSRPGFLFHIGEAAAQRYMSQLSYAPIYINPPFTITCHATLKVTDTITIYRRSS